ncbi:MAG: DUF4342 domain-containing protein [Sarcina sp.]
MENITLEKVDQVIERTCVTYKEAKEALEVTQGNVLEAIIYIEEAQAKEANDKFYDEAQDNNSLCDKESVAEFKAWIMNLVKKGTLSRIKIKKEDNILLDVPVNAGISAAAIAVLLPPILVVASIAVVGAKLTIELTKTDGSTEIVNKFITEKALNVKDRSKDIAGVATSFIKIKTQDMKEKHSKDNAYNVINTIKSIKNTKVKEADSGSNFSYTVNFEDID